jgi:DNA-binding transcriptional MocR family regulator
VVIPNFGNPLGSLMSDDDKKALLKLVYRYPNVTLIEDDIYGELSFSGKRPRALKSFDTKGNVIYCSSVSKTLSPGMRTGWVISEKYHAALCYQKYVTNTSAPILNQMVVATIFANGRFERHLKNLRATLARASQRMTMAISEYFPKQTKITRPEGGYVLWLELPTKVNTDELQQQALDQGISIAPGNMFSLTNKYKHCMRISCALPWSEKVDRAVLKLGQLIESQL